MKCRNFIKWILSSALFLVLASLSSTAFASDTLSLRGIGDMSVPKNITFSKGAQEALPFMNDGGVKRFFIKRGASDSDYYSMTYSAPPDFSYGWAMSHRLGIPYLLDVGEISHKNDSALEQMDVIAEDLNKRLIADGAVFSGKAPLVKVQNGKKSYWTGSFVIKTKQQGIVYNEAYQVILQCDGYFTTLGIINSDADQAQVTEALRKMVMHRKYPGKNVESMLSHAGTSLTEYE